MRIFSEFAFDNLPRNWFVLHASRYPTITLDPATRYFYLIPGGTPTNWKEL